MSEGLKLIKAEVEALRQNHDDSESAHATEDGIYILAIERIAAGDPDAQLVAAAALEAENIEFSRWYA